MATCRKCHADFVPQRHGRPRKYCFGGKPSRAKKHPPPSQRRYNPTNAELRDVLVELFPYGLTDDCPAARERRPVSA